MPKTEAVARPVNRYANYHAHVYFDEQTRDQATQLCAAAAALHGAVMGRVHSKRVGPHPRWSCQLAFEAAQFDRLIPWLEANRGRLTLLVHGQTGNALRDHTANAAWLGEPVVLNLAMFGG